MKILTVTLLSKQISKRRKVREVAVQTLYQMIEAPEYLSVDDAVAYALDAGNYPEDGYGSVDRSYLNQLIKGVQENKQELDQKIEQYLTGWSLSRLARIDLTILRLAMYEIFYMSTNDVPNNVAVDEAIELSKTFSDDKSRQFISGVLAQVLNELK